MFKSASNEIDLVDDSEFRNMINLEEPFYNEWIIARCGVIDDGKGVLSKEDFEYKNSVWDAKKKEARRLVKIHGGGLEEYSHIYRDYIPDNFSKEKYENILPVVSTHNIEYRNCKEGSVKAHQIKLFSE